MEIDEALSLLLSTLCELNGIKSLVCNDYQEFRQKLIEFCPDVVLVDWGSPNATQGLLAVDEVKKLNRDIKIIFSSCVHNKKQILATGADFYLPKPYDTDIALKWIKKFLFN